MRVTLAALVALAIAGSHPERQVIKSTGGLPAHVAGALDITDCQQSADGEFFIFDRRNHAVYSYRRGDDAARKIIQVGGEPGRILDASAFDLATDGSFVIADAPGGRERVQIFLTGGGQVGGFLMASRNVPRLTLGKLILSGIGSLEYTGKTLILSQPELGSLMTEYGVDGRAVRSFGELRRTGHEGDVQVHLALNSGLAIPAPSGGYYFVFLAGVPMFRKYDAAGALVFERHVEGVEVDEVVQNLPSTWPRRKEPEARELPLIMPSIRTAAADAKGNLWISLASPYTYVYDADGEKTRIVQLRAAGTIAPSSMSFTPDGRLLVSPGCYAFTVN